MSVIYNPHNYNYHNCEQLKSLIGERIDMIGYQDNHGSRRCGKVHYNNYICEDIKFYYGKRTHLDNSEFVSITFYLRKDENSKRRSFVSWGYEKK